MICLDHLLAPADPSILAGLGGMPAGGV